MKYISKPVLPFKLSRFRDLKIYRRIFLLREILRSVATKIIELGTSEEEPIGHKS